MLSTERIERISRYKLKEDRIRSILSEILVKYMLCEQHQLLLEEINFKYNEYGKPFLLEPYNVYFNISHSGQWIICGSSDTPIGVDIEGRTTGIMSIANRFFSRNEYDYIRNECSIDQKDMFCKIWTLKESYIKCIGKGLCIPLQSFRFEFYRDEIKMYNNDIINLDYLFASKKIDNDYHMAVCTMKNGCNIWDGNIEIISVETLLNWKNDRIVNFNKHVW